jgi:hypothetical protein
MLTAGQDTVVILLLLALLGAAVNLRQPELHSLIRQCYNSQLVPLEVNRH